MFHKTTKRNLFYYKVANWNNKLSKKRSLFAFKFILMTYRLSSTWNEKLLKKAGEDLGTIFCQQFWSFF